MNGQNIIARVLEITPDLIKYKKFNNPDGPLFSVSKSSVHQIIYENGTKDIITEKVAPVDNLNNDKVEYKKVDSKNSNASSITYSKVEYNRRIEDNEVYNLVKVNPLLVLIGEIPFYYERRLADHVGIEFGLGMTLTDYFTALYNDDFDYYNDAEAQMGYSFSVGLHLYTSKNYKGMEELYFCPEFKTKTYYSSISKADGINITPPIDQNRTTTDFQLKLGYIDYWSDNVTAEYYCGIGIRKRDFRQANITWTGNALITEIVTTDDMVPCISAGLKIGFGWR